MSRTGVYMINKVCVCVTELQEDERERWEAFTSGQLADTNKKNTVDLVSGVCVCVKRIKECLSG